MQAIPMTLRGAEKLREELDFLKSVRRPEIIASIAEAREHGDLTGGFKSVGEALEQSMQRLGVVKFGQPGDAFDPNIHDAMMHTHSDEVTQTTAVQVLQAGYMMGERLLRPARVAVADPQPAA